MWLLIIILLWCSLNTILWIKSSEPYNFRVHFLFIPFMFSDFNSFRIWYNYLQEKIKESFNEEFYYQENYIKSYLLKQYKEEFKKARVYDIQIRMKDGYQIYIYALDYFRFKIVDMEMLLFDELRQKCTVKINYDIKKSYITIL